MILGYILKSTKVFFVIWTYFFKTHIFKIVICFINLFGNIIIICCQRRLFLLTIAILLRTVFFVQRCLVPFPYTRSQLPIWYIFIFRFSSVPISWFIFRSAIEKGRMILSLASMFFEQRFFYPGFIFDMGIRSLLPLITPFYINLYVWNRV